MTRLDLFRRMSMATKMSIVLWTFAFSFVIGVMAFSRQANLVVAILAHIPLWTAALCLSRALQTLWRRTEDRPGLLRFALLAGGGMLAGLIQTPFDVFFLKWAADAFIPSWQSWTQDIDLNRLGRLYILYTWSFWLNITLFWALSTAETAREQQRRAMEAEAAAQSAQLALLRLQLNPHFLFNTLNAISAMVMDREPERANRMIERLSDFLRASLITDPQALVALGEEFDTIEAYLEIESVRFEDRLDVRFQYDETLRQALVPGFILQPLVENAMKYAVAPAMRLVTVTIEARADGGDLVLAVSDNGDPLAAGRRLRGSGVGLDNTRARLANLYGAEGRLTTYPSDQGFRAEARLPLTLALAASAA